MSSHASDTRRKKPSPAGRGAISPQQMRQRRPRILRDKIRDSQEEKELYYHSTKKGSDTHAYDKVRIYIVVTTAIVVTVVAILNYSRPAILFHRKKTPRPMYLATLYPPDVVMERDLPRFFQTYSIATPGNKNARKAAIKVSKSRKALREGTGNLKVILNAWDSSNIDQLLERNICGRKFEVAYRSSSQERQDDLLMWCVLTTRISEGFFLESVEMISNAFTVARKRGMLVNKVVSKTEADDTGLISNAYYLHPRLPGEDSMTAPFPAAVLGWLLHHPEGDLEDPSKSLQQAIYDLASSDENKERYIILEEVCQTTQPSRALAKQCTQGPTKDCCFFVLPASACGHVGTSPEDEGDIASKRQSLRA